MKQAFLIPQPLSVHAGGKNISSALNKHPPHSLTSAALLFNDFAVLLSPTDFKLKQYNDGPIS